MSSSTTAPADWLIGSDVFATPPRALHRANRRARAIDAPPRAVYGARGGSTVPLRARLRAGGRAVFPNQPCAIWDCRGARASPRPPITWVDTCGTGLRRRWPPDWRCRRLRLAAETRATCLLVQPGYPRYRLKASAVPAAPPSWRKSAGLREFRRGCRIWGRQADLDHRAAFSLQPAFGSRAPRRAAGGRRRPAALLVPGHQASALAAGAGARLARWSTACKATCRPPPQGMPVARPPRRAPALYPRKSGRAAREVWNLFLAPPIRSPRRWPGGDDPGPWWCCAPTGRTKDGMQSCGFGARNSAHPWPGEALRQPIDNYLVD